MSRTRFRLFEPEAIHVRKLGIARCVDVGIENDIPGVAWPQLALQKVDFTITLTPDRIRAARKHEITIARGLARLARIGAVVLTADLSPRDVPSPYPDLQTALDDVPRPGKRGLYPVLVDRKGMIALRLRALAFAVEINEALLV